MATLSHTLGRVPYLGQICRYGYRLLASPNRITRIQGELSTLRQELAQRNGQPRLAITSTQYIGEQLSELVERLGSVSDLCITGRIVPPLLSVDNIRHWSRNDIQGASASACCTSYLGDQQAICRVLTRYLMYVNTIDRSLAPHMMMNGFWETWITQAIARYVRPGMRAVDIGANVGYFSLLLADCVGHEGRLWAVEPNSDVYALLRQSIEINGFNDRSTLLCKACGAADGEQLVLSVPVLYQGSAATAQNAFDNYPDLELRKFDCETVKLDTVIDGGETLDFIKVDAEGAEPAIWDGMQDVLRRSPNVTIAMEFEASRYADPYAFVERILADGFRLQRIESDASIQDISSNELMTDEDWSMLWLQRE